MSRFFSDVFIKQIDKGVPCMSQFSCSDLESNKPAKTGQEIEDILAL